MKKQLTDIEKYDRIKGYIGLAIIAGLMYVFGTYAYHIIISIADRVMMGIVTGSFHI